MRSALIGYTGFAGSNVNNQHTFDDVYNSKNITDIKNKTYDLIVSAGNSSLMWKVNQQPEIDWQNIQSFIDCIKTVKAKHFVLLSTIEVYDNPFDVDEDSILDTTKTKPYAQHRYKLEQFIRSNFASHTIIRLPNLFGKGLKKNFVFDLIHDNRLDLVHKDSLQQWYNLDNIWKDINTAVTNNLSLVNFATEPIRNQDLAKELMDMHFTNTTEAPPRRYNMLTKYASVFHAKSPYLYQKEDVLKALKKFVQEELANA